MYRSDGVAITGDKSVAGGVSGVRALIGSGDRIGLLVMPFLVSGLVLNVWRPALFSVGGPSAGLRAASVIALVPGITIWLWSVVLILMKVPRHKLITGGPYALVKHPLYTGVALLVLPWAGFLLNSWLGAFVGIVLYIASRIHAPAEETSLATTFGAEWDEYCDKVKLPWI